MATTIIPLTGTLNDGYTQALGPSYPPSVSGGDATADTIYVQRFWSGATSEYSVAMGYLSFTTLNRLPEGHSVFAATLRLRVTNVGDQEGDRSLTIGWRHGGELEDFILNAETDAHVGTDLGSIIDDASNDFVLSNFAHINQPAPGSFSMHLHISGGLPTAINHIEFASSEHASLPEPCVILEHGPPRTPLSTNATVARF